MDTTTQPTQPTTQQTPALSLEWRPWFGDESEMVAYASTEPTAQHPWGLEVGVPVNLARALVREVVQQRPAMFGLEVGR